MTELLMGLDEKLALLTMMRKGVHQLDRVSISPPIGESFIDNDTASELGTVLNWLGIKNEELPDFKWKFKKVKTANLNAEMAHAYGRKYANGSLGMELHPISVRSNFLFNPQELFPPTVTSGGSIFEAVFAGKESINSPDQLHWVVAETNVDAVKIHSVPTADLKGLIRKPRTLPKSFFQSKDRPTSNEQVSRQVGIVIEESLTGARRLPIGADAVMCLSNETEAINRGRARVAANLWRILTNIYEVIGFPAPRFICNGYLWENEQMVEEAKKVLVPDTLLEQVVLKYPATTVDHGPALLDQIGDLPSVVAFVTSTEHITRSFLHLAIQLGARDVGVVPFEAPTVDVSPYNKVVIHEVETLLKHQAGILSLHPMPGQENYMDGRGTWAKRSMGWNLKY